MLKQRRAAENYACNCQCCIRPCARLPGLDARCNTPDLPSLQIGHTTDGGYGLGWKNDTGDSDDFPFDDGMAQKLANEVGGLAVWGLKGLH